MRYETSFIHAPARGATGFDCKQVFRCRVSIHAPARGATKLIFLMFVVLLVSIHAPARGATIKSLWHVLYCLFQSTHLQEVRHILRAYDLDFFEFQSTHLQEVRLLMHKTIVQLTQVSIHAPTRGATCTTLNRYIRTIRFQSTHLQEVRPCSTRHQAYRDKVSIHAPTRGATRSSQSVRCCSGFQSTHLQEVRPKIITRLTSALSFNRLTSALSFNPRTYKRCDFLDFNKIANSIGFNPRTYKRCDLVMDDVFQVPEFVSIHAPTRGATSLILIRLLIA